MPILGDLEIVMMLACAWEIDSLTQNDLVKKKYIFRRQFVIW